MRSQHIVFVALVAVTLAGCAPEVPENRPIKEARWLDQNWADGERFWYHHATQGTNTFGIPYAWFVALEQPGIKLFGEVGLFRDQDYLRGFGFIPSVPDYPKQDAAAKAQGYAKGAGRIEGEYAQYDQALFPGNADLLPVGFARTPATQNPMGDSDLLGLTCAACHTGHLEFEGVSLRIDGGPAITDLDKFREALALAMVYTRYVPGRFGRFAERVLGPDHSSEQRAELKQQFKGLLAKGKALNDMIAEREKALEAAGGITVTEGFGRLDALNRIGNQVFAKGLIGAQGLEADGEPIDPMGNLALIDAPVNFPHIWSTSWFDWVQYDASIMQPMVRNAGEALGVAAQLNLGQDPSDLYRSSAQISEIYSMETMLAGESQPTQEIGFAGLRAPEWPTDLFGAPDTAKVEQGRALYGELCQGCHLPTTDDPAFWTDEHWKPIAGSEQRFLVVKDIKLQEIGTDPAQAEILTNRTVRVPEYLGVTDAALCQGGDDHPVKTETLFATALASAVQHTVAYWYDAEGVPPEQRKEMDGDRPNCVQATLAYKARPLNGIWATAPFLHNGSVPTLYHMLVPAEERPESFCLGSRQFDPKHVGYETACVGGDFELDTSIAGNTNLGHEFRDGEGKGIIGRALSEEERWALVAFLKTL